MASDSAAAPETGPADSPLLKDQQCASGHRGAMAAGGRYALFPHRYPGVPLGRHHLLHRVQSPGRGRQVAFYLVETPGRQLISLVADTFHWSLQRSVGPIGEILEPSAPDHRFESSSRSRISQGLRLRDQKNGGLYFLNKCSKFLIKLYDSANLF